MKRTKLPTNRSYERNKEHLRKDNLYRGQVQNPISKRNYGLSSKECHFIMTFSSTLLKKCTECKKWKYDTRCFHCRMRGEKICMVSFKKDEEVVMCDYCYEKTQEGL